MRNTITTRLATSLLLLAGCESAARDAQVSPHLPPLRGNPPSASYGLSGPNRFEPTRGLINERAADPEGVRVSGRLATHLSVADERRVTHVMAIDPEVAATRPSVVAVDREGAFVLHLAAGRPYVLVFVDDSRVGVDMVAGIFRAGTLDALWLGGGAEVDLERLDLDDAGAVHSSVEYESLLLLLGLDATAAEYLGSIDDLSLRYANPDIDANGAIDALEGHRYALDIHMRATLRRGAEPVRVRDITNASLSLEGVDAPEASFNLTSIYVVYPTDMDATRYVGDWSAGVAPGLINGASFAAERSDGFAEAAPTSFSALGFGDSQAWGADYDQQGVPSLELPGASGVPATLRFTLGATGQTLTFANVVTLSRVQMSASGNLAIFIRFNTDDAGLVQSVDYNWVKQVPEGWVLASPDEVDRSISSHGGMISVHRSPWSREDGLNVPTTPSGRIEWTAEPLRTDEICGLGVSYDDKLGIRHFVGGAEPNETAACTR